MEEIILARIAIATTAAARSRSPTNFFDASQSIEEGFSNNDTFHRQTPKEVPILFYRFTTTVSCNMLKANKLNENGHDNHKRREMILKVLKTEDLLTMVNKMRPPPDCTEENPTGYSPRRMIHPKYCNQRQIPINNFNDTNVNFDKQFNNENNSNWLFTKTSGTNDINPRMYVLKRCGTNIKIPDTEDFSNDPETFEWKYNNYFKTFEDEEFKSDDHQQKQSDIFIHQFVLNNVEGQINYNVDQFLI